MKKFPDISKDFNSNEKLVTFGEEFVFKALGKVYTVFVQYSPLFQTVVKSDRCHVRQMSSQTGKGKMENKLGLIWAKLGLDCRASFLSWPPMNRSRVSQITCEIYRIYSLSYP